MTTLPKLIALPTQSKYGSAHIFVLPEHYGVFDATAPGMSPEKSLDRAKRLVSAVEMLRDGAMQFSRLTGPALETYARTFAALARETVGDSNA